MNSLEREYAARMRDGGAVKIWHKSEHDAASKTNDLCGGRTVNRALTALHLALTSNSVIRHQYSQIT